LMRGASGVTRIDIVDLGSLPIQFGGQVGEFDPKKFVQPRKAMKLMCREIEMGFAACGLAVEDARLDTEQIDSDRFGIIFGSEMLYGPARELREVFANSVTAGGEFDIRRFGARFTTDMFPLWMLKYLPNMPACHAGIAHQAYGPNNTVVQGEASSLLALIEAVSVIERGWADVMIAGGTGSRLQPTNLVHLDDRLWSHHGEDPAAACRPFDVDRDGMVNGEGSGAFILESELHAQARGASILARVAGSASVYGNPESSEHLITAIRRSMDLAMQRAQIRVGDVDHVNAHGLSSLEHDRLEAQAIQASLGEVPVTAPKSFFGNLGAGGGSVELAASVLAFQERLVPRTLNHAQTDACCPINVIRGEAKPVTQPTVVALNQSQTGQAAAVVIVGG
jgi:3-oxoacyl-[acyl-carrier-protein] synthase II